MTIIAYLNPKKTNTTNVMRFTKPSFIQGEGKKVEALQEDVK